MKRSQRSQSDVPSGDASNVDEQACRQRKLPKCLKDQLSSGQLHEKTDDEKDNQRQHHNASCVCGWGFNRLIVPIENARG